MPDWQVGAGTRGSSRLSVLLLGILHLLLVLEELIGTCVDTDTAGWIWIWREFHCLIQMLSTSRIRPHLIELELLVDCKVGCNTLSTFHIAIVDRLVLRELLLLIIVDHYLVEVVGTLDLYWVACVREAC